ncbi:MAG TPA: PAS domain-containing sensor histidine kinase, partial [Chitinophagaceae bacterium]|nr:PAS domain-containing sensor histidine kinase [Chitinophagaceae bacterium]
ILYCQWNNTILTDEQGNIETKLSIVNDITERKKAELALIESEAKYRTIVDTSDEMIHQLSTEGKIIWVNESWKRNMGVTDKEVIGKKLPDLVDEATKVQFGIVFPRLMKGENVSNLSCGFITKTGNTIFLEGQAVPLVSNGKITGTQAFLRNVTERKMAEEQLEESYHSIRQLTEYLQDVREEERTHIAREIHDELGQQLTVMMMDVAWLNRKIAPDNEAAIKKTTDLIEMLDNTVKSVRRISSQLRPSILDDLGLVPAMEIHLKEFESRSGILTQFTAIKKEIQLTDPVKNALFRIFQESLTNVARHSGAKKVVVRLETKNSNIELMIEDNGTGFDEKKAAKKRTLGVLGMKERAIAIGGTYHISGKQGKGTTILVSVPLHQ